MAPSRSKLSSQHVAQVRPYHEITFLPLDPLPGDPRLAGLVVRVEGTFS
jgi:hypothetical protein